MIYTNGDYYEGDFKKSKCEGYGMYLGGNMKYVG